MPAITGSRRPRKDKKSRLGLWAVLTVGLLLGLYLLLLANSRPRVPGDRLRLDEFVTLVGRGQVVDARILDQDEFVRGTYRQADGSEGRYSVPYVAGMNHTNIPDILIQNKVPTTVDHQFSKRLLSPATLILPALVVVVVFVYLILSHQRGSGLFSVRSGAVRADGANPVTFADVAGQEAALTELREVKEFLADPARFAAMGAQVPRGILLFGPPGCGKTLVARALAGEAGAAFFSISGSDFVEMYVGVGAARVRDLFREARLHAPAIVFIDELDSVGRRRGHGSAGGNEEQEQALNQILAEIDGFSPMEGIIVIGATNRPDVLDPALLRPGRFDRTIGLERPDEAARHAILQRHAANKRVDPVADLADVARRAIGLTGADLASVMNEAALLAAREGRDAITQVELDQALQRILEAPERQRRLSLREASVGKRFAGKEKVTFADVAGADEVIEELADVRDYLAHPEVYTAIGARVPRGILLTGPPGCGKTLLARAVAGEANAAFFSVGGSDFVELYVGVGASRVRDLFAEAAAVAPAIVFIDEIDSIGGHRATSSIGGSRETEQTLNQILVELDGFSDRSGIIVMAATNRPDMLDRALIRPGRFDRQVAISVPDRVGRRAILELHAKNKPLADDVDLNALAGLTRGMTGADLANVLNEAALLAARRGIERIPMALLDETFDRATLGLASRGGLLTDEERRAVAYHEAGHALVARALPGAAPPHKLTIVPRGTSLGHCRSLDTHDRVSFSQSMLIDVMAVGVAGRMAETLVLGEAMGGAASDLAQVRSIARQMVCDEAMSETLGLVAYPDRADRLQPYSEETARAIDIAERKLVEEAADRARKVLTGSRDALERVAEALIDRETVTSAELEQLAAAPIRRARPVAPGQLAAAGTSGTEAS